MKQPKTINLGQAQLEFENARRSARGAETKLRNAERALDEARAKLARAEETLVLSVRAVKES